MACQPVDLEAERPMARLRRGKHFSAFPFALLNRSCYETITSAFHFDILVNIFPKSVTLSQ